MSELGFSVDSIEVGTPASHHNLTVWSLTVEYDDVTETQVFTTRAALIAEVRSWFNAEHRVWDGEFSQNDLDLLHFSEFHDLLTDYGVFAGIESHELKV